MIDELKRFLLVSKEGNLTRTAEKIFITQSALTQSIHRLEKHLNTKLFYQKGKQLQLTDDGQALVIISDKILQLWSNVHDPQMRKVQTPIYSIGMFDNVALLLGKYFKNNMQTKNYKLELTIDSSGKLFRQLQLGTLDAALCIINRTYQLPSHLTILQTYSEELLPVSSHSFSEPIEKVPFILYNRGSNTRMQIDEFFMKIGVRPTIYAESTSVTFMRELALLGCGVALLPKNLVKQDLDQGNLKKQKMQIRWKREYGLFVQKYYSAQNQFIKDLQTELQNSST